MKIFFCDVCNESIPVKLVQSGQVHTVKGKVICSKCLPVNASHAAANAEAALDPAPAIPVAIAAKPRERSSSSGVAIAFGVIGCLLGAGALVVAGLLYQAEQVRADRLDAQLADLSRAMTGLKSANEEQVDRETRTANRFTAFETELGKVRVVAEGLAPLKEEMEKEKGRSAERQVQLEAGFGKAIAAALEPMRSQAARIEAALSKNTADAQSLRNELARLTGRVDMLGSRVGEGGPIVAPPPEGGSGGSAVALRDLPPSIAKQVELLSDPDDSKVWAALTDLGNTPDPRVIPYVIPTLNHQDSFVRHQATMLLGDLNAKEAVEKLIEALADEEAFVREGAYTALRKITRQSLRFDAHGTREQRTEAKAAWEKWWQANRDKVLGS